MEIIKKKKKLKIGLALGGGGVRGYAHIGALKALEDEGIEVDIIAGVSAGAIAGSNYAFLKDARVVEKRLTEILSSDTFKRIKKGVIAGSKEESGNGFFFSLRETIRKGIVYTSSVRKISFVDEDTFNLIIESMVPDIKIEETKIPFFTLALDLIKGKEVIFKTGNLREAVKASSSIPGIFPPVKINNQLLVDGGWLHLVPVIPLKREDTDVIIAVDVSKKLEEPAELMRGINIILRAYEMVRQNVKDIFVSRADVIIRPKVGDVHWSDYGKARECINEGYSATLYKIDEIKKLIVDKAGIKRWWFLRS